jgi:hypothetical protein
MNAVERNVSGSCRNVTAPIRLSSLRATSASALESAAKAVPSSPAMSTSTVTASAPPAKVTPTASAIATTTADCSRTCTRFCPTRPRISGRRRTGVTSSRSTTPRSRSSIVAMPFQPLEKNAVMTSTPGTRYCV